MTLIVLPIEAVNTVNYCLALGSRVVGLDNLMNHSLNFVIDEVASPAFVFDGVINTFLASVADALH